MFSSRIVVAALVVCAACGGRNTQDANQLIREADRLAWLTNWTAATPVYARAEDVARDSGDARAALYAKFGRLRGEMQIRSLPDVSSEIANDLESQLARDDRWLRLRALTAKADIDLEWDVQAAHDAWQEALQLATELQHAGWMNRARGDLGMIAFLRGNSGEAGARVGQALQVAARTGDVGGQLRYLSAIGAGLLMAGDPRASLGYVDKALALAKAHPETGFPYPAHSTRILALVTLQQFDEAEVLNRAALQQAENDGSRIKQVELLMMAASIARTRGREDVVLSSLERAVALARAGRVQRLLGDAEAERASVYRRRGELNRALPSARAAVEATKAAGSRWALPQQLQVQASTYEALGRTREADQAYEEAADVLEGTMLNVPSTSAQARLIGVMSEVYTGHFRVAVQTRDPEKALAIVERARGRALADVLRGTDRSSADPAHHRRISGLQIRLMRARTPDERRSILDAIWQAEQDARPVSSPYSPRRAGGAHRVSLAAVQQTLRAGETFLQYVLTEPNSYCLVITRSDVEIVTLASAAQINGAAETFVADISKNAAVQTGRALHGLVIDPLTSGTGQQFIIVPDGQLHRVPFDVLLQVGKGAGWDNVVTTAPSATVFTMLRGAGRALASDGGSSRATLLAIGGVPYDTPAVAEITRSTPRGLYDAERPPTLSVIPGSRSEVLSAARLVPGQHVVLTGSQATETDVKRQDLGRFDILHFAVHAFADPEFPARAALVVLGDPTAGEDGLLQPHEIRMWDLNASVVVLSACDTSVGPTIGQEGVQNLARAFLAAGARSVITTLWAVSDRVSMELMNAFYGDLAKGEHVAVALANAKRSVVQRLGPPALPTVAAFQLVGAGDATVVTRPSATATTGHGRHDSSPASLE